MDSNKSNFNIENCLEASNQFKNDLIDPYEVFNLEKENDKLKKEITTLKKSK